VLSESPQTIDHGSSRTAIWLRRRRTRIALWIAAAESLVVYFSHDLTRWTVIGLAIIAVLAWMAGRESRSGIVRSLLWIFAASQLLAVIGVIFSWVVKWAVVLVVIAFVVGGLIYLFSDRR
jgi:hypothetical protein